VTAIPLGRRSPERLGATYPPTRLAEPQGRKRLPCSRGWPTWCCCAQRLPVSPHRLLPPKRVVPVDSSLLLWSSPRGGEPLAPALSCAVRTFLQRALSGLAPAAVWQASRTWLSPYSALCAANRPS